MRDIDGSDMQKWASMDESRVLEAVIQERFDASISKLLAMDNPEAAQARAYKRILGLFEESRNGNRPSL